MLVSSKVKNPKRNEEHVSWFEHDMKQYWGKLEFDLVDQGLDQVCFKLISTNDLRDVLVEYQRWCSLKRLTFTVKGLSGGMLEYLVYVPTSPEQSPLRSRSPFFWLICFVVLILSLLWQLFMWGEIQKWWGPVPPVPPSSEKRDFLISDSAWWGWF